MITVTRKEKINSNVLDDCVLYLFSMLFQNYKSELNNYPAFSRSYNVVGNIRPKTRGCSWWGNNMWGCSPWGKWSNTPASPTLTLATAMLNRQTYVRSQECLTSSHIFFNDDCSKYLSVGYYPARDYQPLVEVGVSTKMPVRLTEEHVRTFAEHLPRIWGHV